jgi:DMSO/TMAO reductase YedYZ heme-binding membrane subunit
MLLGLLLGLGALDLGLRTGSTTVDGWQLAARWTARVGFPVFILTYSISSLGRLWHTHLTRAIWRDRRWWGLGFAAAHTVHLYALVTFYRLSGRELSIATLIGGGGAYAIMYLMALTSNDAAMRALGRNWRRLHTAGIHWLWFIFTLSYFGRVLGGREMPWSGIALGTAVAALALRIAAWRKGKRA